MESGNVGIGTTNPSEKLTVAGGHGDTKLRLYSTGDGGSQPANLSLWASEPGWTYTGTGIGYNVKGSPYYGRIDNARGSSYVRFLPGETKFEFQNTSNTYISNVLVLKESGNVGIGTTGPGAKLEVAGQVKITGGSPGANKVLTSDANGLATWEAVSVPSGVIVMWSGTLASIPSGWALCDGTNGTPNLRDRFILGVPPGENPGATGGASDYTLTVAQLPPHTHNATTQLQGLVKPARFPLQFYYLDSANSGSDNSIGFCDNTSYTYSPSATTAIENTGSGASIDNRPSYYKLAFIMKL